LDMNFLHRFNNVHNTPHGPHIMRDDMQAMESRFSESCGNGPVGGFVPTRDMPFRQPDAMITTFTEENADFDTAKASLKRARQSGGEADVEGDVKECKVEEDDFAVKKEEFALVDHDVESEVTIQ